MRVKSNFLAEILFSTLHLPKNHTYAIYHFHGQVARFEIDGRRLNKYCISWLTISWFRFTLFSKADLIGVQATKYYTLVEGNYWQQSEANRNCQLTSMAGIASEIKALA